MGKFCSNCGNEIKEKQDVCLNCGQMINREKKKTNNNHAGYYKTSNIIMLVLGILIFFNGIYEEEIYSYLYPGMFSCIGAIIGLSKNNKNEKIRIAGIFLIIAAVINTIAIEDFSIFGILALVFGILDIVYSRK